MMGSTDFEHAIAYAIRRLEDELDPILTYHSAAHTRDDVMAAVERLALLENVNGEDLGLMKVAAAYHDLGYVEDRGGQDHEALSDRIARQTLPDYGFSQQQIERVSGMIMATKMPQHPRNFLEELIVDADLDSLGREDYFDVSLRLRQELANFGIAQSDAAWYEGQLQFLSAHKYFTPVAKTLRAEQKTRNINAVKEILQRLDVQ